MRAKKALKAVAERAKRSKSNPTLPANVDREEVVGRAEWKKGNVGAASRDTAGWNPLTSKRKLDKEKKTTGGRAST